MWLATIERRRVKESLRARLQVYQRWVFKMESMWTITRLDILVASIIRMQPGLRRGAL